MQILVVLVERVERNNDSSEHASNDYISECDSDNAETEDLFG